MKLIISSIVFIALIMLGQAYNEKCEFEHNGKKHTFNVGETYTPIDPTECVAFTCLKGGDVQGKTCPDEYSPKCKFVSDHTKPFPDCCPKEICDKE